MILTGKLYGLVNETGCFLVNPGPGGFRAGRVSPLPFRRRRSGFRRDHCYYHHFPKLLPPWPIDGCLQVAHVSPMAAKVRNRCDYSSELLAVLGLALRDRAPNPE